MRRLRTASHLYSREQGDEYFSFVSIGEKWNWEIQYGIYYYSSFVLLRPMCFTKLLEADPLGIWWAFSEGNISPERKVSRLNHEAEADLQAPSDSCHLSCRLPILDWISTSIITSPSLGGLLVGWLRSSSLSSLRPWLSGFSQAMTAASVPLLSRLGKEVTFPLWNSNSVSSWWSLVPIRIVDPLCVCWALTFDKSLAVYPGGNIPLWQLRLLNLQDP